ncbi:MAG: HD domain-containing protein [Patescibacteria group bacterium]|jgi:tRNA nucleotidyltransferase/poly(A) polymerase
MFTKLFEIFQQNGFRLYHVGGSVRNILLQLPPKDYDFTTDALPEKTQELLTSGGFKHYPIGEKFGTIATFIGDKQIEITTHRRDLTAGRHPDVAFSTDINKDLSRRDFTINSIAQDNDGTLIDPFGGKKDIENKLIKATGNPYERFAEDPLRMLRAIRFISQLGFSIEEKTLKAIKNYAQNILNISRERWLEEMNKLLVGANVSLAIEYLRHSRLLYYMIPEMIALSMEIRGSLLISKNVWLHTLTVVEKSSKAVDVRWAALLHDLAKPQTRFEKDNEVHFFQHEILGAEMVEGIARRFKMSNDQRRSIKGLVALHQRVGDTVTRRNTPPVSISALRRVIRECEIWGCNIMDLVSLFEADCSSKRPEVLERQNAHVTLLRQALTEIKEEDLRPKLPSGIGTVIMEKLGLSAGPEVGKIKQMFDRWLLNGNITPNMTSEEIVDQYLEDLKEDVYI